MSDVGSVPNPGAVPPPPGHPDPGRPRGGFLAQLNRPVPAWVLLVVFVFWVYQFGSVRADQVELQDDVTALRAAVAAAPPSTAPLPADVAPADAEASRRAIANLYRAVFSPSTTPEEWASLVVEPGDLGPRLAGLADSSCAGSLPRLDLVRFEGPDRAAVQFRFVGPGVPEVPEARFRGGAVRTGGSWQVTPDSVETVLDTAVPYCR